MNKKNALVLKNISASYNYGKHLSLENISFLIKQGETVAIIGPNGSGKTTLLKIINGLLKPKSGTIKTFCKSQEIGYIPQHSGLIPMLPVLDNVLMGALNSIGTLRAIFKFFPDQEKAHALQILKELGLDNKAKQKVHQLSGGEKRRVAIARALMQKPKILLADEILSNLDFVKARQIMKMLQNLKEKYKLTIIMVEHNLCMAHEFSDQALALKEGKLMPRFNLNHFANSLSFESMTV